MSDRDPRLVEDVQNLMVWEIGANHMGDPEKCIEMMRDIARQHPGARVKLQWFDPNQLASRRSTFADHRRQRSVLWNAAMSWEEMKDVIIVGHNELKLQMGVTVFSAEDAAKLLYYDVPVEFFKIASPDAIDENLIEVYLRDEQQRPLMISTGGMTQSEISALFTVLRHHRSRICNGQKVTVMHCMSEYPATSFGFYQWAYLQNEIDQAQDTFKPGDIDIGFSDHTQSLDNATAAIALGAEVVERHVYSNVRQVDVGCATLINEIASTVQILSRAWDRRRDEQDIRFTRRYWCADKNIPVGTRLDYSNIALMRCVNDQNVMDVDMMFDPRTGLKVMQMHVATKEIKIGEPIMSDQIKVKANKK